MQQKTNKIIAILLAVMILYSTIGTVISLAVEDMLTDKQLESQSTVTNNKNVEVDISYEDGKHTKASNLYSTDTKIQLKVRVKNAGYLENMTVDFSDANFKISADASQEGIQKIDEANNKILLGKISAGEEKVISLTIAPVITEEVNADMFSKDNTIKISGKYINEKAEEKAINKEMVLHTEWEITKEQTSSEIEAEVTKYIPYKIDNKSGVLIETTIKANMKENILPVKTTHVEYNVPRLENNLPEKVIVIAKQTSATNGKINGEGFSKENWNYDAANEKVTIDVSNTEQNGKIQWKKNAIDEYKVISIYSSNTYDLVKDKTSEIKIQAKVAHSLYSNMKEKNSWVEYGKTLGLDKKIGTMFDIQTNIIEEKVNKGYIYNNKVAEEENKIETQYNVQYVAIINDIDLQNKLVLEENDDKFVQNDKTEQPINAYDKSITVNKSEIQKVLGNAGSIEIIANDAVINTINSSSTTDDNGNIVIDISKAETNKIKFNIKNPESEGIIEINVNKAINKDLDNARKELEGFNAIKTIATLTASMDETQIETISMQDTADLVEPTTKANISIENNNLAASKVNENVELKVTLEADSADDLLYSNPTVTIDLPEYITDAKIQSVDLLHSEELKIKSSEVVNTQENKKAIKISIEGTQTKYNDNLTKEITLLVYTDLTVKKLEDSQTGALNLIYTNENDIYGSTTELVKHTKNMNLNFIVQENVKDNPSTGEDKTIDTNPVDGKKDEIKGGLIVTTSATSANKDLKDKEAVYEGQTIEYKIILQNKSGADINNLKVVAANTNAIFYDLKTTKAQYQIDEPPYFETKDYTYYGEITEWTEKQFDTIGKLANGETKILTYQIVVKEVEGNDKTTVGTVKISSDEIAESSIQTIENTIKQAELKVNARCEFLEEDPDVNAESAIPVEFTIKNISGAELDNTELDIYLSEGLRTDSSGMYIGDKTQDFGYELIGIDKENNIVKLKLSKLNIDEERKITIYVWANEGENNTSVDVIAKAKTENNNEYWSNKMVRTVNQYVVEANATQTCDVSTDTILKNGDNLTYTINVTNTGKNKTKINITDRLPKGTEFKSAIIEKNGATTDITDKAIVTDSVIIVAFDTLEAGESLKLTINVGINTALANEEQIENYATIEYESKTIQTNKITHKIKENQEEPEKPDPGKTDPEKPDPDKPNPDEPEVKKYKISGKAWQDENQNSCKDPKEKTMSQIKVYLVNAESGNLLEDENGKVIEKVTTESGEYEFTDIMPGKYLVLFKYDNNKYEPVEYQKVGIDETSNSNVIEKEAIIDGKSEIIALTDTITIKDKNKTNVNIGLRLRERFDLRLDKYVTKITIQNSDGTKQYEEKDKKIAKVEIPAKRMVGTKIIIEYKIKVTNEGNVAGYVNDIVDYIPDGLKFNSELNKDWYESEDGNVHTKSLAREKINIGETKEVTLTLIRTLDEANAEIISNNAEINSSNSINLGKDIDSEAGNRLTSEDDMSNARIVISIKTGATKICLIGIIIVLSAITGFIVIKKKEMRK